MLALVLPMNAPFVLSFNQDKHWPLVLNTGVHDFNGRLLLCLVLADMGKLVWSRTLLAAKCIPGLKSFGDCKA